MTKRTINKPQIARMVTYGSSRRAQQIER